MKDEKGMVNCRYYHPVMRNGKIERHCHAAGWADDKIKTITEDICKTCEGFKSKYIEFPLIIQGIDNTFSEDSNRSLSECGQLVKISPCGEEYGGKTYLGILLGDLPFEVGISFHHDDQKLHIGATTNPAIFVPELRKIIYGYESWWGKIESPEDLKDITPEIIQDQWYVKLLVENPAPHDEPGEER